MTAQAQVKRMWLFSALCIALAFGPGLGAQEKPPGKAAPEAVSPAESFRVQVVVSEYDGANKIASLPYTMPIAQILAGDKEGRAQGSMRTGIRVPVTTASKSGENTINYAEVGTNLDVRIRRSDADRYALDLSVERSWLYVRVRDKDGNVQGRSWVPGDPSPEGAPVIHTFRSNVQMLLRDGRAAEITAATDPITGHVYKVEAVLSVLK